MNEIYALRKGKPFRTNREKHVLYKKVASERVYPFARTVIY